MKKIGGILVAGVVCFGVVGSLMGGTYGGGSGTEEDPYQIGSAEDIIEMSGLSDDWDDHFMMITDVNMADYMFTTAVIAPDTENTNSSFQGIPFTGVFDGGDHKIIHLTIDTVEASNDYLGLFGKISGEQAEVKNLGLENVSVIGGNASGILGSLCGINETGTISNCYTIGPVTEGSVLGGLCGVNDSGTISDCHVTGSVTGYNVVGGLCGSNGGTISNCHVTGDVMGAYIDLHSPSMMYIGVGGLVGLNGGGISDCSASGSVIGEYEVGGLVGHSSGFISDCSTSGSVIGEYEVGGLVGINGEEYGYDEGSSFLAGKIEDCSSTSAVKATGDICGGLVGNNIAGSIIDSYSAGSVTGHHSVGGLVGVNGDTIITCHGTSNVRGRYSVGGLVGSNAGRYEWVDGMHGYADWYSPSTVSDCYSTGSVLGYAGDIGGLCGVNTNTSIIERCYASNIVSGDTNTYVLGGLCGRNENGTINDCYSTGSISTGFVIGGLCGVNSFEGQIANCYSTSFVEGGGSGGFCGINWEASVLNCFWDIQISGIETSDGGIPKTTFQLHQQSTLTDWDLINVWNIGESQTYPYLRTHSASDLNKDRTVNLIDLSILTEQWMRGE